MLVSTDYPRTTNSEARVIIAAGNVVCYFDSTRDAAIYAARYACQFAMFVRTEDEQTNDQRMMVTFDCSF